MPKAVATTQAKQKTFASDVTRGGQNASKHIGVSGNPVTVLCPYDRTDCGPVTSSDTAVATASVEIRSECAFEQACDSSYQLIDGASYDSGYVTSIPGAGQVQINLFIPQDELSWLINPKGDGRTFDAGASLAESRASVFIDFETGFTVAGFTESCRNR